MKGKGLGKKASKRMNGSQKPGRKRERERRKEIDEVRTRCIAFSG